MKTKKLHFAKKVMLTETNTNAAATGAAHGTTGANWNPVLIALVRRAMPNLMAYDVCGVQPMTGPTGLIFAMKSTYQKTKAGGATAGDEALFNEAISRLLRRLCHNQVTVPMVLLVCLVQD